MMVIGHSDYWYLFHSTFILVATKGAALAEANVPPAQPTNVPPLGNRFGSVDDKVCPVTFQAIGLTTSLTTPVHDGSCGFGP